jgi:hypothetical protein
MIENINYLGNKNNFTYSSTYDIYMHYETTNFKIKIGKNYLWIISP